ncbi:MAG TPA: serine hydrolase domain-containing protein, partial [Chitinophagaceae bacterium]|nr:serine hydrolase domain-containing protein [Chitinophagaceae bacterium]
EIGSITKTFTGLLVAHAIMEGKMKITDDIRKYLPGNYPNLQYPNGSPVKLGYLLAHTAQFPYTFDTSPAAAPANEAAFLQNIRAIHLDSLKTIKYSYSNVGYQLLGYMLEQLYHLSYMELVKKYITGPLQMEHTQLNYAEPEAAHLLQGYNPDRKAAPPTASALPGAGNLHSNTPDMLKYIQYQLAENDPVVKLTHRIIYGNIDEDAIGFQWSVGKTRSWDYYIRTDGGTKGFRSFCVLYPDWQAGIILLSNQTDNSAGGGLYGITVAILNGFKQQAAGFNHQ